MVYFYLLESINHDTTVIISNNNNNNTNNTKTTLIFQFPCINHVHMEKNSLKHMCPYTQIQAPFPIIVSVVVSLLKNVTIAYTNISVEQYDFTAD